MTSAPTLRLPRRPTPAPIFLVVNPYVTDNDGRNTELFSCLLRNLEGVDDFVIMRDRPTFGELYAAATHLDCLYTDLFLLSSPVIIIVIANADIYFPPETIELLRTVDLGNHALCLTRYNQTADGPKLQWKPQGSQDAWVFQTPLRDLGEPLDFRPGTLGCDNRFAAELERAGYRVVNPCLTLKTIHMHAGSETVWTGQPDKDARLRKLAQSMERVPRPYRLVPPCRLEVE